jgi:transposase
VLRYKRLEKGRFRIPKVKPGTRTAVLDGTELAMLLDGIDVADVRRPALWEPPTQSPATTG